VPLPRALLYLPLVALDDRAHLAPSPCASRVGLTLIEVLVQSLRYARSGAANLANRRRPSRARRFRRQTIAQTIKASSAQHSRIARTVHIGRLSSTTLTFIAI
jgi:hypothetical protein